METFHVNNYKGLKDLELRGLSRVNLIVGRNNVGKSSLLEVLSLYYSGGSVNELLDILDYSGERVVTRTSSYSGETVIDNEAHFLSLFNRSGFEGGKAPAIVLDDGTFVISLGIGYQKEKRIRKDSSVNHILEYLTDLAKMVSSLRKGLQFVLAIRSSFCLSTASFRFSRRAKNVSLSALQISFWFLMLPFSIR